MTIRQPLGVAGLIIAANTPIANVAWKVFPALICGNAAVLKAAEDTPATAWAFARIAHEAGLPAGVLNVVQGYGEEAGAPLVAHPDVQVISFTGKPRADRPGGGKPIRRSRRAGGSHRSSCAPTRIRRRGADGRGQYANAGQVCLAGTVLVERSVADGPERCAPPPRRTVGDRATERASGPSADTARVSVAERARSRRPRALRRARDATGSCLPAHALRPGDARVRDRAEQSSDRC
jgi:hypothetical protein